MSVWADIYFCLSLIVEQRQKHESKGHHYIQADAQQRAHRANSVNVECYWMWLLYYRCAWIHYSISMLICTLNVDLEILQAEKDILALLRLLHGTSLLKLKYLIMRMRFDSYSYFYLLQHASSQVKRYNHHFCKRYWSSESYDKNVLIIILTENENKKKTNLCEVKNKTSTNSIRVYIALREEPESEHNFNFNANVLAVKNIVVASLYIGVIFHTTIWYVVASTFIFMRCFVHALWWQGSVLKFDMVNLLFFCALHSFPFLFLTHVILLAYFALHTADGFCLRGFAVAKNDWLSIIIFMWII